MRRRIERDYTWNGSSWAQTNEIHFIYDGNVVVQERDANNNPLVTYTRGNDLSGTLQGAGGIGGLMARTDYGQEIPGSPTTAYFHADGNGNITMLIYMNQLIGAKYLYDPYGNTLSMSGPLASLNVYRFSSKEWNASAGLYYYLYRFYDPNLQRWANRDPIHELGGFNLYRFVGNDPIGKMDPLGLSWSTAGQAIWTAAGYIVPGSEFPAAFDAAPDAAKIAILKKFEHACYNCLCNSSDGKCPVCDDWEKVKKKLGR